MTKGSHPRVQTARDDKLKEFNDFQGNKKRSGIKVKMFTQGKFSQQGK